jgi:hypothetical protein
MKKIILSFLLVAVFIVLLGANFRRNESSNVAVEIPKKKCLGYTIIEFGKGLDCNGDTLKLVRVNGVQVLADAVE